MEPLRIGILTSRRVPGLRQLLEDPNRNVTWELTLVVGSEPSLADLPLLEKAEVPVELRPRVSGEGSPSGCIHHQAPAPRRAQATSARAPLRITGRPLSGGWRAGGTA